MRPNRNKLINSDYLLHKLKEVAISIGRTGLKPAITLYYVMRSPKTPKSDKLIIVGALCYLIFPIDILSAKRLPIIGWIDELASLVVTYEKMVKHITPEIEQKVTEILDRWLPQYTNYQIIK